MSYTLLRKLLPAAGCVLLLPACGEDTTGLSTPDRVPPTVSITEPAAGTVLGQVSIVANATDDRGIAGVRFRVDEVDLRPEDTEAPYQHVWNTGTVENGEHLIDVIARDAAGNEATAAVTVTVENVGGGGSIVVSVED